MGGGGIELTSLGVGSEEEEGSGLKNCMEGEAIHSGVGRVVVVRGRSSRLPYGF